MTADSEAADAFSINVLGAPPHLFGTPKTAPAPGSDSPTDGSPSSAEPQSPAQKLVHNAMFQTLVNNMEKDGDEAQKQCGSQMGDAILASVPPNVRAQYASDSSSCSQANLAFNDEWNKIATGKTDDTGAFDKAFQLFWLNINALQRSNARVEALIQAGIARYCQDYIETLKRDLSAIAASVHDLEEKVKIAQEELEKAIKSVSKIEVKRVLNAAASVLLLCAPEVEISAWIVSLGGILVHIAIDGVFGQVTVKGTVAFVAGDGIPVLEKVKPLKETIENFGKAGEKMVGAAALVATLKFDTDELTEVLEEVANIRGELGDVVNAYNQAMSDLQSLSATVALLEPKQNEIEGFFRQAMARGDNAAKQYGEIQEEIARVSADR